MAGYILYEGPSRLDGAPIVVIATGFGAASRNAKTGDMIQTWIIRTDTAPHSAQKSGHDTSVCGQCPLRPANRDNRDGRGCYVKTFQAPRSVYESYHRGIYPKLPDVGLFADKIVRIGSYGDPAAAPQKVWRDILQVARQNTAYTHQWQRFSALRHYAMASVESPELRDRAKAKGYRTFRTKQPHDPVLPGETVCPASKEAGARTKCANCRLCGGSAIKAKDIVINLH